MYKPFYLPLALLWACNTAPSPNEDQKAMTYPETREDSVTDDYFGTLVADPYRWLENDTSKETASWVKSQNEVTNKFLSEIPYREDIRKRLEQLYNYERIGSPSRAGDWYFFYKNDGLQNQSVIYYQQGRNGEPKVFIDPNEVDKNGTTAINLMGADKDNKYMAYSQSVAGSDWSEIRVREIATNKDLDDKLEWVKFSGAAWYNDGFFYSRYPKPAPGSELSSDNKDHSVYYHKLGTPQSEDKLVHRNEKNPNLYHFCTITEDDKYLVMYVQEGTDGFETWVKDLDKDGPFVQLFGGMRNKSSVIDHVNGEFLVLTDIDAPNYRVVAVTLETAKSKKYSEVIPESETAVLSGVNTAGGKLILDYLENATSKIVISDYNGENQKEVELPTKGSAGFGGAKRNEETVFYTFSSYTYPSTVFEYNLKTGETTSFFKPKTQFNPEDYVVEQKRYTSKDGTEVTMFVVHKKGLKKDGNNPTLLYGYGGFNISLTPYFSPSKLWLLENGGVFAVANLRGGGEYGEEWHKQGMMENKQNVFNDFIAAAEYLIAEGYTSSEKLAIQGGSNGGLLVGASITQRPDLFAVALPAVGVMDMLRYHRFTVGKGWIPEYGCADSSQTEFAYLKAYSPLHNIKPGTKYPATMVTTADHDDRVVPAHSFKFAATLQKAQAGEKPTLIRIEEKAGHGAGKPISKFIDEETDIWSFTFYNMGIEKLDAQEVKQ